MSLYLGPIHTWLWNKILFKNSYIDFIIDSIDNKDINQKLNLKFEEISISPLSEQIDTRDIHGWLQSKIDLVESRFAYLIFLIKNDSNISLNILKEISFNFGLSNQIDENMSKDDFYTHLNNIFLDGMPCDHINVIIKNDFESLIFKHTRDIHSKYFEAFDLDSSIYYQLKEEVISGILSKTKIKYYNIRDNTFEIIEE